MIVFKTFLKILNKYKFIIILYTIILLVFGIFNFQTNDNNLDFVSSKPDILIINQDEPSILTQNLIEYLQDNANLIDIPQDESSINDALFYREVNYVIYIPKNYRKDFLNEVNPQIEIKSTGNYQSSLAQMLLSRYLKVANVYQKSISDENILINNINKTLDNQVDIEITSKLDTNTLEKATFYFNFASYSLLACLIYVICLILSIFNSEKIHKRTIISSVNLKQNNHILFLSNCLYSFAIWLFYLIIGFVLVGNIMFTTYGLIYLINSLIFTICATSMAFFIGNILTNKDAINGIVNVIALGSSFLCGAFVPQTMLGPSVLKIAHLLPTYYYIKTNELLTTTEVFNSQTLKPIIINMFVIVIFSIVFIILTNILSKKKQKIG